MGIFSVLGSGLFNLSWLGTDYPFMGVPMAQIRAAFDHPDAVDVVFCLSTRTVMPVIPRPTPVPAVGRVA